MSTTKIDSLELEVQSSATSAVSGIDALSNSLLSLKNAVKGGIGLRGVVNQLRDLNAALGAMDASSSAKLGALTDSLSKLSSLGNLKISASIGNQIRSIGSAAAGLGETDFSKVGELSKAVEPLTAIGKASGLQNTITQLRKIPELSQTLNKVDWSAFTDRVQRLANGLSPLSSQLNTVSVSFSQLPANIRRVVTATNTLPKVNNRTAKSYVNLWAGLHMAGAGLKTITRSISAWIHSSNSYIENINLFNASMGQYTAEAQKYTGVVSELMGIDPGEWMRNQGVFMTITKGFGVASERAYTMSQQLTQLGYDLSSFFNISYEDAMQKLQSGISGELEPLRRLGYDLSQARLQAIALSLGIDKAFSKMTQAEKAQLRYYAVMTQVTTAQGDMARTLEAPANQLRILKAQLDQAARALGNIFIPILNAVLPYAIALAKAVRLIADAIAQIFGFAIPEMNWGSIGGNIGDVSGSVGDLEDNLGGAGDKAKALKNALLGIDELNIISPTEDLSLGSSGIGGGTGGGLDFELPTYDFIGEAVSTKVDEIMGKLQPAIDWAKSHLDDIYDLVLAIAAGLLTWNFTNDFISVVDAIKNNGLNKVAMGITIMVTGITLSAQGAYDIGYEGASFENILKTAIGDALIVGGALLAFGTGPLGWTVGIGVALITTVTGIVIGANEKALEEDLKKRFGELILSSEEISTLVKATLNNEWYSDVQLYLDVQANLDELQTQIENKVAELNQYSWKVHMGLVLNESEMSSYKSIITEYIKSANKYISDRGYAISIGIKATLDDGEISDSILESSTAITKLVSDDLAKLGVELQGFLNEAFSDGILTIDEQKVIDSLTNQINNILEIVSQSEFEAKLDVIDLKYGMAGMSQESWEAYKAEVQAVADEMKVNAETTVERTLSNLKANISIAEYYLAQDPNNEKWKAALVEAQEAYQLYMDSNPLELECNNIDFIINDQLFTHFNALFGNELQKAESLMELEIEDAFYNAFIHGIRRPEEIYEGPITELVIGVKQHLSYEFENLDISTEARKNIHRQLTDCVPKLNELKQELNDAWNTGNAIPQSIKDGLTDIYTYKAMSSNMGDQLEGVFYLVGHELSKSPGFYDMLAKSGDLGRILNEELALGIKSNLSFVEDASGRAVKVIKDGVTVATLEMTPELRENMKNLGVNLSEGVTEGTRGGLDEEIFKTIFGQISGWFCNLFGIHSPSTVFTGYGQDIVSGLNKGLGSYTSTEPSVATWANGIIEWFTKGVDGKNIIDRFREFGGGIIDGFKGEVSASYGTSQSPVTTWAYKIKEWFTGGSFGGVNSSTFGSFAKSAISGFTTDTNHNYAASQSPVLTWAGKVKDWFTGSSYGGVNGSSFGGFARSIINAFTNSTSQNYTNSQSSITTWATGTKDWFTSSSYGGVNSANFATFAQNAITGFKNKVNSNYAGSQSSMTAWASKVKEWFTDKVSSNSFYTIASNVINGFKNGIGNLYTTAKSTIDTWGSSIIGWFKNTLGIHSPSKVFYEMAGFSVEGFNKGFDFLGKSTKDVVNNWADSFTTVTPTMGFAVDASALKYYNSDAFSKSVSATVASDSTVTVTGFMEGMEEFYGEYVEPMMVQMAADMRRQAEKNEQTVVQIGNRTVSDAVITQQKANGFVFA